ncbi:hypothetical protein FVE85_7587 [Porphyridium purpureum]|uniref:Proteasome assembly chaperone 4 n=1 Tax=Porphyridium purpureum TaxID=35688 RepID=A0A5J4ZAE1_PORPP|nr:hypothetical protein FVE85_7587 [Porphyridium purpureum]|eukprot:POR2179..scf295_1
MGVPSCDATESAPSSLEWGSTRALTEHIPELDAQLRLQITYLDAAVLVWAQAGPGSGSHVMPALDTFAVAFPAAAGNAGTGAAATQLLGSGAMYGDVSADTARLLARRLNMPVYVSIQMRADDLMLRELVLRRVIKEWDAMRPGTNCEG